MSVPMGLANIDSGLDDDQVQSLVHQLRHEYSHTHEGHDAPAVEHTAAEWAQVRGRLDSQVSAHPSLRPQRRAGMLTRIRGAETTPPPDMVYAAQHIRSRAIRSARLLEDHLAVESARIGVPDVHALQTYEQGRRDAPTGRQNRATTEQRNQWPDLPLDPRTRHGLTALAARPDNPDGRRDLITEHHAPSSPTSTRLVDVGYHSDAQRLEVLTSDGILFAYRGVPEEVAHELLDGSDPDGAFHARVQGNAGYQYRDATQAAAAGVRRRCPECGQFTGASHSCLGRQATIIGDALGRSIPSTPTAMQPLASDGAAGADLTTYDIGHLAGVVDQHRGSSVTFPIGSAPEASPQVSGSMIAAVDAQDEVAVAGGYLFCSCGSYRPGEGCAHTRGAAATVRERLTEALTARRQLVADQTAAAIAAHASAAGDADVDEAPTAVDDVAATSATSATSTRPAIDALLPDAPNLSTFSYAQDPERFAADVRAVLARPAAEQVPWLDGVDTPVLYGFGADREFGVELEFDIDRTRSATPMDIDDRVNAYYRGSPTQRVVGRVAQAMQEAGLTTSNRQAGYHSAARSGYTRTVQGGWTYESDCSVSGGELVSPVLSNSAEGWASVERACTIIGEHGGVASAGTGSHITVSAGDQAGQAVRLTRFMRFFHHHQPDLYVMAAAGHNRGRSYSTFITEPPLQGYHRVTDARLNTHRYSFINVAHVGNTSATADGSRIEFRLWDGSNDPGRVQAQVRMSTAILDYSSRDRSITLDRNRIAADGPVNPDHTDFARRTEGVRDLLDVLFRRDQDKLQATALWAAGLQARRFNRTS